MPNEGRYDADRENAYMETLSSELRDKCAAREDTAGRSEVHSGRWVPADAHWATFKHCQQPNIQDQRDHGVIDREADTKRAHKRQPNPEVSSSQRHSLSALADIHLICPFHLQSQRVHKHPET